MTNWLLSWFLLQTPVNAFHTETSHEASYFLCSADNACRQECNHNAQTSAVSSPNELFSFVVVMKDSIKSVSSQASLIKHPLVIVLTAAVIILAGGVFFLSQNKNQSNVPTANVASSTHQESNSETHSEYGHVHVIFKNPADGSMLMGTHNGLFISSDEGKTFQKVEVKGDVVASDFMNFAYDPNSKTIFAGGHDLGVVKSTDGGVTWIKSDSGIRGTDIHALSLNPLDTARLYAFSVDNGVFGTKDGGKNWFRIDDGPTNPSVRAFGYMATPSSMDRSMGTDKTTDIGYLWAGTSGGLYSSFACFCGWNKTLGISDNATIYTIAPDPVNRSNMLVGTKDGIYKSFDEGKSFTKVENNIKNVAGITFDQSNPKSVFAVTENGTVYKSSDSGNTWQPIK